MPCDNNGSDDEDNEDVTYEKDERFSKNICFYLFIKNVIRASSTWQGR